MYIDFVTQHRVLACGEVLPRNPSCWELDLEILGYLNLEAIHCDGATGIVAIVHSICIFEPSLNEQRGVLGKCSGKEAYELDADEEQREDIGSHHGREPDEAEE